MRSLLLLLLLVEAGPSLGGASESQVEACTVGQEACVEDAVSSQAPAGSEFRVNSYLGDSQRHPSIASDANGDFVVVWASGRPLPGGPGQDGSGYGVFGQRFNASGVPQGTEFQINSYTTGNQSFPSVASDANGGFVVVWSSAPLFGDGPGQDGSGYGVFGQLFNASGVPQGSEFQVNSYTTGTQWVPSVASDANGNFVVVWSGSGAGDDAGVFGQRFDAAGAAQGSEFEVNAYTTGNQSLATVASDPNGNFVVVWSGAGAADDSGIFGQRFNAAGAAQGTEFQANSFTTGNQFSPVASTGGNGNFVVVWQSNGQDGGGYGIFGQRYDGIGGAQGGEFEVNAYTTGNQSGPSVTSAANGRFVVTWQGSASAYSAGVFGRHFDASGTPEGAEFRVDSPFSYGVFGGQAVASDPDGDFVVVWTGYDGNFFGIFGQRYGDLIFQDGFESADVSRWSFSATDSGDLSVSGAAALASTAFGLQAVVNDTNSLYVENDTSSEEDHYRARFYFDPNGFDPGEGSGHDRTRIFIAFDGSNRRVVTLVLRRLAGLYALEGRVRLDDGSRADTSFIGIANGPHQIEIDWRRSTTPTASDGSFQMWIDASSVAALPALNNNAGGVGFARLGALSVKTGASGTLYFDEFESRRQSYIGP
jgi:hypothetical protein